MKTYFHPINELPLRIWPNPFVLVWRETSLIPTAIEIRNYKKFINEINTKENLEEKGSLLGWCYASDIFPDDERLTLTTIAKKNKYYKDLKL